MKTIPLPSLDENVITDAVMKLALQENVLVSEQNAVHIYLRNDGVKKSHHWYEIEGGWRESTKYAIEEIKRKHGEKWADAISSVEIVLTHKYKKLKPETLPGNSVRGLKGIMFGSGKYEMRFAPNDMIARNLSFGRAQEIFLEEVKDHSDLSVDAKVFDAHQLIVFTQPEPYLAQIYRGNQVIDVADVNLELVQELAYGMALWMQNNVHHEGRLTYKYWPSLGKESAGNNMIRQFMGTVCLFRMAKFYKNSAMRSLADKNLVYNLKHFFKKEKDFGYIVENDSSVKLGSSALAAIAVMEAGDMQNYSEFLVRLVRFSQLMWDDSGLFRTFYKPQNRDGENQNFYPGETLLFWAQLYRETGDEVLLDCFMKSFLLYREFHRENPNPAFIPWHTQAYYLLWEATENEELKEFIFEMNDWLLDFQQWDKAPCPDMKGRFYDPQKPYGPPHASATGVYIEGLIDAWKLAKRVGDGSRQASYAKALRRAIRNIKQLQFSNELDMFYIRKKDRVRGGIRTTEYDNTIRVDNVQHNLMGIMKVLESGLLS